MTEYRLCHEDDVAEETSKEFFIETPQGDQSVFAVRKDGILTVYKNSCPHLGVPLNFEPDVFLDMENAFILCSTHGALFKIDDGECVHGPCLGQRLETVSHSIKEREVFVHNLL